ncbi:MAG: hypothetical protein L0H79_08705 [Intrasporangium sp.]|uniref:hypothetical protein n=1 Tax=Intrasporangium sp. TaxID=1925024 RepID=UPI0026486222|nr:hypothetical protein [Intrasporangium sp.]MDN5795815.1 hypothetical protein [Intrasporangium sp.]
MSDEYVAGLSVTEFAERWRQRLGDQGSSDLGTTLVARDAAAEIVGFVSAGPSRDDDAPTEWELYAINLLARTHSTGLADELLGRALGGRAATLWVAADQITVTTCVGWPVDGRRSDEHPRDLVPAGGRCVSWWAAAPRGGRPDPDREARPMFRPVTHQRALIVALAGALSLAACTGNGDDETATTPTPAVAPTQAASVATSLVTVASTSQGDASAAGDAARAKVFQGPALEAADARAKVLAAGSANQRADAQLDTDVTVLGISRESDSRSEILARTSLKKSNAPVLVLLVGDQNGQNAKIAAMAPLVEDATLDALDPVSEGSALVDTGAGLVAKPADVSAAWAGSVAFPDPRSSELIAEDPWSNGLRKDAAAQSKALGAQGVFAQTHDPTDILGGLRLKGGSGAVVFAHLKRLDTIALHKPTKLTPSKEVTALSGIKTITTEAQLTSSEFIAFVVPASGQARVVAARDQLIAAEAH